MSEMSTLAKAIAIAAQAHGDQVDKAGEPYILHPLRMMLHLDSEAAQIVAVLHDVVEDTALTLEDLRAAGFAAAIVEAVDCVTRRETESYAQFIERLQDNALARQVKLADLADNMDLKRISTLLTAADLARLERYHLAWTQLTQRANASAEKS
jgi:(p)ppGpp synthase/HD superfamily hydrolase